MTLFFKHNKVFAILTLIWGVFLLGLLRPKQLFSGRMEVGIVRGGMRIIGTISFFVDYPDASNERAVFSDGNFTGDQVIS